MSLNARLAVLSVTDYGTSQVHSNDPASPNFSFSKFTPSAELKITITNPEAFGFFKAGDSYDLTFDPLALAARAAPAQPNAPIPEVPPAPNPTVAPEVGVTGLAPAAPPQEPAVAPPGTTPEPSNPVAQ